MTDSFAEYNQRIIDALDGYCSLSSVYGGRRWIRGSFESKAESLAREASFHINPAHQHYACLWGREYWLRRRNDFGHPLIAWTEDKNGRIVRGWARHLTGSEFKAYDTEGNRSCPIEASWIDSIRIGFPSLPALPFQRNLDGDADAAACVQRLIDADLIQQ